MLLAGAGQSDHSSAEKAAEQAAAQAMTEAGLSRAQAVVLFFTAEHAPAYDTIVAKVARITGCDRIVGCSGAGVLTGRGEIEGGPGLALLALGSDEIEAEPFLFHPIRGRDLYLASELAEAARVPLTERALLLIFPDAYQARPAPMLRAIEERLGRFPVVGAGASEPGFHGRTYQFCRARITDNAVSGLSLVGNFSVSIGVTQGCQPVSQPMVITAAEGNVIAEIDGRPAFGVLAEVLRGPLAQDLRRALAYVFVGLPSEPEKNSVGPGEYVVRNIAGLDPGQGLLAVASEVFEGERMVFLLRDGRRAREDLEQMLERLSLRLRGRKPQCGFYFNCCARGSSIYGIPGIDTAYIRKHLGAFPLAGFFGSYELGPLGQRNHLLAYTGVLALITD
jgi:small ligand-binding sensory domain FIST